VLFDLLKENPEHWINDIAVPAYKEIFENENQLQDLKKRLVRFGTEEVLRRKVNDDS